MMRLDIRSALAAVEGVIGGLAGLESPAPPDLLFSVPLTAAEIRSLATQTESSSRHHSEMLAASPLPPHWRGSRRCRWTRCCLGS